MGQRRVGRHPLGQAVHVGRGDPHDVEQQRLEDAVEAIHSADADAPQRVAVIGARQRGESGFLRPRLAALLPILKRHFQGRFHRRGAVVREKHVGQTRRGQFRQAFGQPDRRGIRTAQQGHVGHPLELLAQGRIQPRMPMPVHVAPQAAHRVDVCAPLDVDQHGPLAALQDQRLVLRHLGKRMPDDLTVPAGKLFVRGLGHGKAGGVNRREKRRAGKKPGRPMRSRADRGSRRRARARRRLAPDSGGSRSGVQGSSRPRRSAPAGCG